TFTRGAVIAGANGGVATGDFTGDGHVDIVAAGSAINVYPGNGSGGFGAPVTTSLSNDVSKVQALYANGDGKLDLLASRQWTMYVALGNGSGGFAMSTVGETDVYNNSFAIGDFDENGTPDFVNVANVGLMNGVLLVFLGQGNGTFTRAAELGGLPHFIVTVADVNKDGHLDLVGSSDRGNLAVFPGNGDGTFDEQQVWHTGPVWALSIGEFNRDTNLDVVLFSITNNHLQFLAGMPAGTFDTYRSYLPQGSTPWWDDGNAARLSVIADMNNDGSPDIVSTFTPELHANVEIAVMLNAHDGTGALQAPFRIETDSDARMRLVAGDVNNDGNQDIVAITSPGVQTFLGNGDGTLDLPLIISVNTNGYPHIADMNGDGALDLVLTHYETSTVLRGTNTGTFGNPTTVAFPIHAIGDVNGDGHLDVLGHPALNTVLGFNHGDGTFSTMGFPDGEYPGVGDLADMNGDGHLDMLLILYSGTRVRFGNGDGTFAPNAIDFSIEPRIANTIFQISGYDLVHTGDFDNDGHLDFVDGPNFYLGNGDGRFRSFANVMVSGWSTFGAADFDGNGTDDAALTTGAGSISIVHTNLGPDAPLTPGITLTPAKTSPQHGETVAYTAALTASEPLPGKVLFARNGVPVALLSHANFLVAADIAASSGSATISATYTGDDRYAPATATVQQTVVKATTALSVESVFPEFPYCGQELFLYVPLSATRASEIIGPQGELIFRVGETILPARRDPAKPLPYNYVVGGLTAGTHTITVEFPGDANYFPSSTSFTQMILPPIDLNARAGSGIHPNSTGYAEARFTYAPIEW
ncbi:MAG TPA: FG-GAP-like repeat-containing protein, partial [Thermoanaerobaculia bacterium]